MSDPNAELAYRVLDHIDAHPEQWDQLCWWNDSECGTAGCFAGWAVDLSGGKMTRFDHGVTLVTGGLAAYDGRSVADAAAALLGIAPERDEDPEDLDLFDASNSRDRLGRLVAETFGPRPDGPS